MSYLARFGRFWFDFIVGDDWRLAIGVVVILGVAHLVAKSSASWVVLVVGVALLLTTSIRVAARAKR